MQNDGSKIRNCKRRGEWAELRFMTRAAEHGLCVSKPWGESSQYDFVVECDGAFVRVQVKSTECKRDRSYACVVCPSRGVYAGDPFEFMAALVIPEDIWYIIPAAKVLGMRGIMLSPHVPKAKYAPYKESWHLLQAGTRIKEIQGCVEDHPYV